MNSEDNKEPTHSDGPNLVKGHKELPKDRDALFRLLTEEIKDLHEVDKLRGWTQWVVFATLISMAWIVIQDIWTVPVSRASIWVVFLVVSLGLTSLRVIIQQLHELSNDDGNRPAFHFLHSHGSALTTFIQVVWIEAIAWGCLTMNVGSGKIILTSIGIMLGAMGLAVFLLGLATVFRFPLPVLKTRAPMVIVLGITVVLIMFTLAIWILVVSEATANVQLIELRDGVLIALGIYVLIELARSCGGKGPVLKETLTRLRRDLVLGNSSMHEIHQRARVALQGMWLSDIVRGDMDALLKLVSDVRDIYGDAFHKIGKLKASVPIDSPSNSKLEEIQKLAVSNTLDVLKTYEARADDLSDRYWKRLRSLRVRLGVASRIIKAVKSDEIRVISEIKSAQAQADADLDRFIKEFHEIQNAWNVWYPNEIRRDTPFDSYRNCAAGNSTNAQREAS